MTEMYLDPPHLSVTVYSELLEVETFARMCEVARECGCTPLNLVEVAPLDRDFEFLADLAEVRTTLETSPARHAQLVEGHDPELRALRVGYSHPVFGMVIVEYHLKRGPGAHPIGISVSAGALGFPVDLWSASQRRSAYALDDWSRIALETAASRCDALYGAVGAEFTLPTPAQIRNGKARIPACLFVSRHLLGRDQRLEGRLREAFSGGEIALWDSGLFFSGWSARNAQPDPVDNLRVDMEEVLEALRESLS